MWNTCLQKRILIVFCAIADLELLVRRKAALDSDYQAVGFELPVEPDQSLVCVRRGRGARIRLQFGM